MRCNNWWKWNYALQTWEETLQHCLHLIQCSYKCQSKQNNKKRDLKKWLNVTWVRALLRVSHVPVQCRGQTNDPWSHFINSMTKRWLHKRIFFKGRRMRKWHVWLKEQEDGKEDGKWWHYLLTDQSYVLAIYLINQIKYLIGAASIQVYLYCTFRTTTFKHCSCHLFQEL